MSPGPAPAALVVYFGMIPNGDAWANSEPKTTGPSRTLPMSAPFFGIQPLTSRLTPTGAIKTVQLCMSHDLAEPPRNRLPSRHVQPSRSRSSCGRRTPHSSSSLKLAGPIWTLGPPLSPVFVLSLTSFRRRISCLLVHPARHGLPLQTVGSQHRLHVRPGVPPGRHAHSCPPPSVCPSCHRGRWRPVWLSNPRVDARRHNPVHEPDQHGHRYVEGGPPTQQRPLISY